MPELPELAQQHLDRALTNDNGRSAELVAHDGPLRQTVIALVAGVELAEHNSPPAASIQVLRGSVAVTIGGRPQVLHAGELELLTHERHSVLARSDAVFLLTTVTGTGEPSHAEP